MFYELRNNLANIAIPPILVPSVKHNCHHNHIQSLHSDALPIYIFYILYYNLFIIYYYYYYYLFIYLLIIIYIFIYQFLARGVRLWNVIPYHLATKASLESFHTAAFQWISPLHWCKHPGTNTWCLV